MIGSALLTSSESVNQRLSSALWSAYCDRKPLTIVRSAATFRLSMPDTDELANRISAILAAKKVRFEPKRMMGGLAFMVDDKMFVGTAKNRLMVRFDPDLHEEVLARPGAGPMDFTGKPMRGFVFVELAAVRDDNDLGYWLDLALEYNPRAKRSTKKKK